MKNEDIKFATELIVESKRNSKRWFIIAVIELFIILAITGMFVWYLYLPEEEVTETTTCEQEADTQGDYSPINQSMGEC